MRNIFLVRTGAATRLYKNAQGVFGLRDKEERVTDATSQNYWMYIVTEEAFSEGDFITDDYVSASRVRSTTIEALKENGCYEQFKKVILTTHDYPISEGIQRIDDEFLEWFVKNPTCEKVEVKNYPLKFGGTLHKIIIPQEDSLSSKLKNVLDNMSQEEFDKEWKKITDLKMEGPSIFEEPKQETLEEAALSFLPHSEVEHDTDFIRGFEFGAKYQAKRMYSEEDMIGFAEWLSDLSFNLQHFDEKGLKQFNELLPLWKERFKK